MLDAREMLADIRAYDEAKAAIQAGEELIPSEIVYALLDDFVRVSCPTPNKTDSASSMRTPSLFCCKSIEL